MPSPVGFSRYTEEKQQILGAVCERLFSIEKRIFDDPSKRVCGEACLIDLNAGDGLVPGVDGSPLVEVEEALRAGLPFHLWACELHDGRLRRLRERLAERLRDWTAGRLGNPTAHLMTCRGCVACNPVMAYAWVDRQVTFVQGDHNVTVDQVIAEVLARTARRGGVYGLIYADGNGQTDFAIEPLARLSREPRLSRVDVLVHVGATTIKRTRRFGRLGADSTRGQSFAKYAETFLITGGLDRVQRRYVYVGEPRGAFQWTAFFMTNYDKFRPAGFWPLDSARGRAIVERVELATDERPTGQIPLALDLDPVPTPSTFAIPAIESYEPASSLDAAVSASAATTRE